jgi:hypothetical protein
MTRSGLILLFLSALARAVLAAGDETSPIEIDPFADPAHDPRNRSFLSHSSHKNGLLINSFSAQKYIPNHTWALIATGCYGFVVVASLAWSLKYRARYMITLIISAAIYAGGLYMRTGTCICPALMTTIAN